MSGPVAGTPRLTDEQGRALGIRGSNVALTAGAGFQSTQAAEFKRLRVAPRSAARRSA